jgi:hypothetical protein
MHESTIEVRIIMADSIIGQRFGMLTVLSEEEPGTDTRGHRFRRFRCHCDCGNEKTVNYNNILCGLMRSCGCTRFPKNPPVDLTGQRFHNLTVLSEAEPYYPMKGYRKRRWLCKCDCGAETIVLQSNLMAKDGTKSCGCIVKNNGNRLIPRMLNGNRYGRLVVIGPVEPQITTLGYIRKQWKCQCDCGNTTIVAEDNLLCGHTRSCGCMKHNKLSKQKFGMLNPVSRIPGTRNWICQCACGGQITVNQDDLFWGSITDCGCQKKKRTDIAGQRFGKLVALRETQPAISRSGVSIPRWLCRCDCGREVVVRKNNLTGKVTRSCGCLIAEKKRRIWAS